MFLANEMKKVFCTICLIAILVTLYVLLTSKGEPAIRPRVGEVTDPILSSVIEKFADAVDETPRQPKPRMELGMTYEGATLNKLAEQAYNQYTEQFPKRVIGWYRLAIVQQRMGELENAIQSLSEGVKYAPPKMDAPHWQLGLWLIDVGRVEEAKKYIANAAAIKPNSLQVQIANGRIAIAEDNPEFAIEILNKPNLISKIPDGYVYQLLGRAYRAAGDEEKSREAWGRAGQSKPKWGDPWTATVAKYVAGLMALRQEIIQLVNSNKIPEARKNIAEYFSHEPKNRVVRRLDAMCDLKEGKAGKAIQKWSILIKEDSNDTFSMLLLAKARMRIKQLQTEEEIAKTKAVFEEILKIDPTNEQAKQLLESLP
jgi:predicted Zn-dependent protease